MRHDPSIFQESCYGGSPLFDNREFVATVRPPPRRNRSENLQATETRQFPRISARKPLKFPKTAKEILAKILEQVAVYLEKFGEKLRKFAV
jgi:hypothetical protein